MNEAASLFFLYPENFPMQTGHDSFLYEANQ